MNKVSIITICLNDKEGLLRTMRSVIEQKGINYEYIIKDGGSTDGSLELINEYQKYFRSKGVDFKVESKRDCGIYDAMNQAIDYCGDTDWIIFLNAGDVFYNANVIEIVNYMTIDSNVALLIGLTEVQLCKNMILIERPQMKDNKMIFCHQSIFVRTEIQRKFLFDISYKIAADRDLIFRIRKQGYNVELINIVISKFRKNGISSSRYDLLFDETDSIDMNYGLIHKKHNKIISNFKTTLTKWNPIFADLVYIWKRVRE